MRIPLPVKAMARVRGQRVYPTMSLARSCVAVSRAWGPALQIRQGPALQLGKRQPQFEGLGATQAVVRDHGSSHLGIGHGELGAII